MRRPTLLAAAALLGLATAPGVNLGLDPLETLRPPAVSHSPHGDDRRAKIDHLLAAAPYDALLLGSSRTGLLDPAWRADTAGRWYNLGLLGAAPTEIADLAAALALRGELSPTLVLGLDIFGFAPGGAARASAAHPMISGQSWPAWIWDQLFAPSVSALADSALRALTGRDLVAYDYAGGGAFSMLGAPRPQTAAAADLPPGAIAIDSAQLDAVRRLREIAEVAGASLCLVWHPHSPAVLSAYDRADVRRLKRAVAGIGAPVLDLMEAPWARDIAAWFDARHLGPVAARLELDAIRDRCPTPSRMGGPLILETHHD